MLLLLITNAAAPGDLWNAKSIKRQDFGIKMKTKPPKRDPRAVLSESCHNVVVVEMGTEKLQKKLKKYMVVVGVESRNEKSLKNVDFKEVDVVTSLICCLLLWLLVELLVLQTASAGAAVSAALCAGDEVNQNRQKTVESHVQIS